jgi:hypothetical protein
MMTMGSTYWLYQGYFIDIYIYRVKSAARDNWDSILHAVFAQGPMWGLGRVFGVSPNEYSCAQCTISHGS